jgi:hypothetical protein
VVALAIQLLITKVVNTVKSGATQREMTEVNTNVACLSFWAEVLYYSIYIIYDLLHPSQRLPPSKCKSRKNGSQ